MRGVVALVFAGLIGLFTLITAVSSAYIVKEGHIGVITRMGEAVRQEAPAGIQFKTPIITNLHTFDVREQRIVQDLSAATKNQLPITTQVTMNWRPDPTQMLEVYRNYGSPQAFATTILEPRLRQAAKSGLSKFQASDLIRERQTAASEIQSLMTQAMEPYPASVLSVQIENVELPPRYREAVLAKEEAREAAAREQYNLEKQALEAQREVQTANAARDAAKARADGSAYKTRVEAEAQADAIRVRGEAEADAIEAQAAALADNPLLVDLRQAERWDGVMPRMILGSQPDMLMQLPDAN